MKSAKWFEAKLLYMEKKGKSINGLRFYTLFEEKNLSSAIKKAVKIGQNGKYPYEMTSNLKFEFIGMEHILECYSPPSNGAMLSAFKDKGSQWSDATSYINSLSKFEIETFRYSPKGIYLANLVYFVKSSSKADKGKVTTCQIIFRSFNKLDVLTKVYKIAVDKKTLKDAVKIRRDCKANCVAEFVGIEDIIPVFDSVRDGMEINRTVEKFKSRNELLKLVYDV